MKFLLEFLLLLAPAVSALLLLSCLMMASRCDADENGGNVSNVH
jgi:hypothetical protein